MAAEVLLLAAMDQWNRELRFILIFLFLLVTEGKARFGRKDRGVWGRGGYMKRRSTTSTDGAERGGAGWGGAWRSGACRGRVGAGSLGPE